MAMRTLWARVWRCLHGGGRPFNSVLVLPLLLTVLLLATSAWAAAGVKTYSVYSPIPIPSDFSYRPDPQAGVGHAYRPSPPPGFYAHGGGGGGRTVSPSLLATTRYVVPPPPGFVPVTLRGARVRPAPHPLSHHVNYHNPGHVPHPHFRSRDRQHQRLRPPHLRGPPPPAPPGYRHGRGGGGQQNGEPQSQQQAIWIPTNGNGHGAPGVTTTPFDVSTIGPPERVTGYISFDQYPSTSTSVVTSKSTTSSKVPMMVPVAAIGAGAGMKAPTTTTATSTSTTAPSTSTTSTSLESDDGLAPSGSSDTRTEAHFGGRKRRKGKRRTTTTTVAPSTTTSTERPHRLKETPEFQVPNPNYDYDATDLDYDFNNVLKRSPDALPDADPDPKAGSGSALAPATVVTPGPFRLSSSLPSTSARPTLLHRIELSDLARIRAKAAAAKATKTKSQHLWAVRTANEDDGDRGGSGGHGHTGGGEEDIKKVISTELRKTHFLQESQEHQAAPPIWRVTRVETSMNYSDSSAADGGARRPGVKNQMAVLPYDGGAQFESMKANRPTVNYVDLVTGESFNPFANSSPPITGDLYNSDGKPERKQIQHQLIYSDDADLRQGSKLPENKTVDFDDTLSHLPQEVPVEPDFKKTRLRLKKKHPLLANQDSIITAEQSVTKNGLIISTGAGVDGGGHSRGTSPMTTTTTTTTSTFRPYTTSRIILTTRKPSSFTTEILNSWNSPTRTSTYATTRPTAAPPTQTQFTTRRNPATTPAFTTERPTPPPTTATRTRGTTTSTTTTKGTTTSVAPPPQVTSSSFGGGSDNSNSGLLDLFTLWGQTNTNSEDGSTTQANLFGFGQNQNQNQASDLASQLSFLDAFLGGAGGGGGAGNQFQNLFPGVTFTTTEGSTSTSSSTTTTTEANRDPAATLSDSEIKSFLNILGVSTPSSDNLGGGGVPHNIQAVLDQQESSAAATPAPTLSTQFVAPSPIPQTTRPPATQAPRPPSAPVGTTAVPSLSAALSNMLAVLSNPFAPPPSTTTVAPPLQDNSINSNAALLAALLAPQNGGRPNGAGGNGNANGGASDASLLSQLLQLGNALDPNGNGGNAQSTRQVEVTPTAPPAPSPPPTTARPQWQLGLPTTRVPSLFDFSSLLGAFSGGAAQTTTTTTSNPLAALLDLNRLLFPRNNNNGGSGGGFGGGNGLGNLFGGGGGLFGAQTPSPTTASPFGNLFNFNSLLNPGGGGGGAFGGLSAATATTTQAPQPIHIAAGNAPIEFHIPTTKRPTHPGPYFWLDMNTFFGGGAGPNDGLRPKVGSRDPFIKV